MATMTNISDYAAMTVLTTSKLEQIAKEAGVSVRTVYRVLQGENKETWPSTSKRGQLIRNISRRLEFSPDASARNLRTGKKMQIAILLRNTEGGALLDHYPDAFEIILGINETLEPAGYTLALATLGDVIHPRNAHSRIFREHLVDGLIVISQMPADLLGAIDRMVPNCLWVHANVWRGKNCLRRDEVHAGRTTAQAMLDLGYRKLVWVGPPHAGPDRHYSEAQRLAGVHEAASQGGVSLIEIGAMDPAELAAQYETLAQLLQADTAFVAYSSHYASWLTRCAEIFPRIAPRDFGLACCDDSRQIAGNWPGLSRMGFSQFELGRHAGEMMLANLSAGDKVDSRLVRMSWTPGNTAWGPPAGGNGSLNTKNSTRPAGVPPTT